MNLTKQIITFAVFSFIAFLVWLYYRRNASTATDRYSTFAARFWAGCVDGCVLWPVSFITAALFSLSLPRSLGALVLVVERLSYLVYTVLFHARYGQTVGKMFTHVRVVDFRTEGKISFWQALLREGIPALLNLGYLAYEIFAILTGRITAGDLANGKALAQTTGLHIVTNLPLLWFAIEVLTMLTNKKRRALHDFIAGTVVVQIDIEPQKFQSAAADGDLRAVL